MPHCIELGTYGIRDVIQSRGGKHLQLRWQVDGHPLRSYWLPLTPSDQRGAANTRAEIRRMLREDGILVDRPTAIAAPAPKIQQRVATLEGRVINLEREQGELKTLLTKFANNGGSK
jgi:hypothetical protein